MLFWGCFVAESLRIKNLYDSVFFTISLTVKIALKAMPQKRGNMRSAKNFFYAFRR